MEKSSLLTRVLSACLFAIAAFSVVAHAVVTVDLLFPADSQFAGPEGKRVHYKSLGEGSTAVVFVHGWNCDLEGWLAQAPPLHGKVRMLFVDLPGFGKSDKPEMAYAMDAFAKGIDSVLTDSGVEKAVLVGHSMGVPVVLEFYRKYPEKVKGLVFVDGTVRALPFNADAFLQGFRELDRAGLEARVRQMFRGMAGPNATDSLRDQIEAMGARNVDPRVSLSAMEEMYTYGFEGGTVKVPAQALMTTPQMWSDDYKAYAKELIPGLDYREFAGAGHFLFMEQPEAFNAALGEFLKKLGHLQVPENN